MARPKAAAAEALTAVDAPDGETAVASPAAPPAGRAEESTVA